jgi:homoprotocatechuate degradation regulator HpaR
MTDRTDGMRPFERSLPMALLKAREAVMDGFRRILGEHGLNEQQWRVIRALVEPEELEIGVLAARVHLLGPSLTRILQNLDERGLVRRMTLAADQRRKLASLTVGGHALFLKVSPHSEAEYARIAKVLGPTRLEALYDLLGAVERDLGRPEHSGPETND